MLLLLAGASLRRKIRSTFHWRGSSGPHDALAIAAAAQGLGVALESTSLTERALGGLAMPLEQKSVSIRYLGRNLVFLGYVR
jgi:hypothetical protein